MSPTPKIASFEADELLFLYCASPHPEQFIPPIQEALDQGANPNMLDASTHNTPIKVLKNTIENGHWKATEVLKLLMKRADAKGNTPLHRAAVDMDVEMVKFLLKHGADITTKNQDGLTAMGFLKKELPRCVNENTKKQGYEILDILADAYVEELFKQLGYSIIGSGALGTALLYGHSLYKQSGNTQAAPQSPGASPTVNTKSPTHSSHPFFYASPFQPSKEGTAHLPASIPSKTPTHPERPRGGSGHRGFSTLAPAAIPSVLPVSTRLVQVALEGIKFAAK